MDRTRIKEPAIVPLPERKVVKDAQKGRKKEKLDLPNKQAKQRKIDDDIKKTKATEVVEYKPRPRKYTFLNSLIVSLTLLSFFTLHYCPPPSSTSTGFTALNPFSSSHAEEPAWQRLVCRPTNIYRTHILEPYIVPRVKARVETVRSHPIFVKHVKPFINAVETKIWRRYLVPTWRQTKIHTQTVHRRFIKPKIPIIRRRIQDTQKHLKRQARPYIARIQAEYDNLRLQLRPISDKFTVVQRQIEAYPIIGWMSKEMQRVVTNPQETPYVKAIIRTYQSLLPYGQRASNRIIQSTTWTYQTLLPHGQRGSKHVAEYGQKRIFNLRREIPLLINFVEEKWYQFLALISRLYHTHVHVHIKSHLDQANEIVYKPYLKTPIRQITPVLASLIMTPTFDDMRNFIGGGVHNVKAGAQDGANKVAEAAESLRTAVNAGAASATQAVKNVVSSGDDDEDIDMDDFFADAPVDLKSQQVPLPPPDESDDARARREVAEKDELKQIRKDIDRSLDMLEGRVRVEGKRQKDILKAEIHDIVEAYRKKDASTILSRTISNLQKEASRTSKAYGKYLQKLSLSPDLDKAAKAEEKRKVRNAAGKAGSRLNNLRDGFYTELDDGLLVKNVVDSCREKIAGSVEKIIAVIVDDHRALAHKMTYFKQVTHKDWVRYREVEMTARNWSKEYETILDNEMKPILGLESETRSEVSSLIEDYRKEIKTNEQNALHKLGGGVGILPVDFAGVKDAADAAIGKSKEQIVDALKAAGVVGGVAAAAADQGIMSSASSIAGAVASSASSAIIGEPTADSIASKAADAAAAASASISSVLDQVSSTVHSATRVVMKAAGAEPTPDTWSEQAEDVLSQASANVASLLQGASSVLHAATRSGMKAVGATPTPESWEEQAEDILSQASASVSSVLGEATSALHAGARTVVQAVGGTPEPEGIVEAVADTAAVLGANLRDAAASVVHDATRSASSIVGATPTPETLGEHAALLSARVEQAAETVGSILADGAAYADQATESMKKVLKDEL